MEDTVTYTSKVPASTWLTAKRVFFYDRQVWTDTVFFLRKQWKLFRNNVFQGVSETFFEQFFYCMNFKILNH